MFKKINLNFKNFFKNLFFIDNILFISLLLILLLSIWLIFMNYTCNVSKGFYSLIKKFYIEQHIQILSFFWIYIPVAYFLISRYLFKYKHFWLFLLFLAYKYVCFKYLKNKKYNELSIYESDKFVKDIKLDYYMNLNTFLKLEKNKKKEYIVKRVLLFFYKNYYFKIINLLGNFYFINLIVLYGNKKRTNNLYVKFFSFK